MDNEKTLFWGKSSLWWLLLVIGILMIPCGIFYWACPVKGYEVISALFGWALVAVGVVQAIVGGKVGKVAGRWWWIVGGFIDMTIGFFLIRNIEFAAISLPFFFGFVFLYWGISDFVAAFYNAGKRTWWINLINAVLMSLIGFLFFTGSVITDILTIDILVSLAFIWWGMALISLSIRIKKGVIE